MCIIELQCVLEHCRVNVFWKAWRVVALLAFFVSVFFILLYTRKHQLKEYYKIAENTVISTKTNTKDILRYYEEMSKIVGERGDRAHYLSKLLNLFSIVHRLTKVWPEIIEKLNETFGSSLKMPESPISTDDLWKSGVMGFVRVQEIYNISTETLVSGHMEGTYPHAKLTAWDCFGIAKFYYTLKHHERAVEWLTAALQRVHEDQSVSRKLILEYLHLAQCFKGDDEGSTSTYQSLLQESSVFKPSQELLDDYVLLTNQTCGQTSETMKESLYYDEDAPHFVQDTGDLCMKEWYQHPDSSELRCRLIHYNLPYLRIWPFKVEELNIDPPLLMFYDVIHNKEMEHFKSFYHNKTRHAINDYASADDYYQDTQYNTWIRDEMTNDQVSRRITLRSGTITNLDLTYVDNTMVASYGLAGEIKRHHDFGFDDPATVFLPKSRADYVTLMYYLNDVEEGGFTAYPWLDLAVIPVKGAALLWFNRNPDWSKIEEVEHTGCPILQGSKWIIVKWFHALGQEFPKCVPGKEKTYKYYYL